MLILAALLSVTLVSDFRSQLILFHLFDAINGRCWKI